MKAEQFIKDYTKHCSNELTPEIGGEQETPLYHEWLTPDQALRAVELAREETKIQVRKEIKDHILTMLNTSIDDKQFFEQLDEYIDEL